MPQHSLSRSRLPVTERLRTGRVQLHHSDGYDGHVSGFSGRATRKISSWQPTVPKARLRPVPAGGGAGLSRGYYQEAPGKMRQVPDNHTGSREELHTGLEKWHCPSTTTVSAEIRSMAHPSIDLTANLILSCDPIPGVHPSDLSFSQRAASLGHPRPTPDLLR